MTAFVEDRSVLTRLASKADQLLRYGEAADQIADFRSGGARALQRPLAMLIHGGFWRPEFDRTHTHPLCEAIANAGWSIVTPEYRRIAGQPDATIADIALAIAELPAKLDDQCNGELILIGHSAGGHLVLWAAAITAKKIRGVLALAPVADLQWAHEHAIGNHAVRDFLGIEPKQRTNLDPKRLPSPAVPIVMVHGEDDAIVPLAISKSYQATHNKARLLIEPNCGHFGLIDPHSAAWPTVLAAMRML